MTLLENDPANACIGCGPSNARGLHLAFERVGDVVETRLRAVASIEGWPLRLHSGVLYTAMLETANWTAYGLAGRPGFPIRTGAFAPKRWVATGEDVALRGRRAGGEGFVVAVEAVAADGVIVATLERAFDFPDAATVRARLGYDGLPDVLREAFPEQAAGVP